MIITRRSSTDQKSEYTYSRPDINGHFGFGIIPIFKKKKVGEEVPNPSTNNNNSMEKLKKNSSFPNPTNELIQMFRHHFMQDEDCLLLQGLSDSTRNSCRAATTNLLCATDQFYA